MGNPIVTDTYTSDPAVLVHDGTVYVYTGHDGPAPGRGIRDAGLAVFLVDSTCSPGGRTARCCASTSSLGA